MKNSLRENAEALAMKTVLSYINGKDPDEAIAKVLSWVDKFDEKEGTVGLQRKLRQISTRKSDRRLSRISS